MARSVAEVKFRARYPLSKPTAAFKGHLGNPRAGRPVPPCPAARLAIREDQDNLETSCGIYINEGAVHRSFAIS
jgi:hypothetical protein